ncbi:MAG: EamA family transporter RarD [Desulfobacterales bacterium]
MPPEPDEEKPVRLLRPGRRPAAGVLAAGGAFALWGASPLYWKALGEVPALEIVAHRVLWSALLLLGLCALTGRLGETFAALRHRRLLGTFALTTLLLSGNWVLYIWAVNHGFILQGSLGYYINPLVNVVLGVIFLRERLRGTQIFAVALALLAVLLRTLSLGEPPWIALFLGITFGLYGLLRKTAAAGALVGLTVETLLLSPACLVYLAALEIRGTAAFLHGSPAGDLLLAGTGAFTTVPLLLFVAGARRVTLSTLGLMQYLAPSGMFLLAVLHYGEPFSPAQGFAFALIWVALALYSLDALRAQRRVAGRV